MSCFKGDGDSGVCFGVFAFEIMAREMISEMVSKAKIPTTTSAPETETRDKRPTKGDGE